MKGGFVIPVIAAASIMGFVTYTAVLLAGVGVEAPYLLYFPAIAFCYWGGRVFAAAVAILLSTVLTWYFFIPPVWSFGLPEMNYNITLLLFIGAAIVMCVIIFYLNREIENLTEENHFLKARRAQGSGATIEDTSSTRHPK